MGSKPVALSPIRRHARPTPEAEAVLAPTGVTRISWYAVFNGPWPAHEPDPDVVELLVDDFRRSVPRVMLEFRDPEGRRVFRDLGSHWKAGTAREFKRDPFTSLIAVGPGLFFLGPRELRRLQGYPADWTEVPDDTLRQLLARAEKFPM